MRIDPGEKGDWLVLSSKVKEFAQVILHCQNGMSLPVWRGELKKGQSSIALNIPGLRPTLYLIELRKLRESERLMWNNRST